jgi:hypothetical protein
MLKRERLIKMSCNFPVTYISGLTGYVPYSWILWIWTASYVLLHRWWSFGMVSRGDSSVGIVQSTALTWNWKIMMTSKYMIATSQYHEVWNKCQGMMLKAQETLVELANWWMMINCFSLGCRIEDLAWLEKCFNHLPQKVRLPLGREFRSLPHAWTSIIKFTHPSVSTSLRIVS